MVVRSLVDLSGIFFQLYGDINVGGVILLKEVACFSADVIQIPVNLEYANGDLFLRMIMKNFNAKLRNFTSDENEPIKSC